MQFYLSSTGPIYVLDGQTLEQNPLEILECHQGRCYCIAIDPLGNYFATGAADALVAVWDINELACLNTFTKV